MKFIAVLTDEHQLYYDNIIIIHAETEEKAIEKITNYISKTNNHLDKDKNSYFTLNYIIPIDDLLIIE